MSVTLLFLALLIFFFDIDIAMIVKIEQKLNNLF